MNNETLISKHSFKFIYLTYFYMLKNGIVLGHFKETCSLLSHEEGGKKHIGIDSSVISICELW